MTDDLNDQMRDAFASAINGVVSTHERGLTLKWVALVESLDADGERGLWTMTSDDCKAWDTLGLLQYALHCQQAQTVAQELES